MLLAEPANLVARDLVERLGELLADMLAPGQEDHPIHWGHVGHIAHVNALLAQAVAFLDRSGKQKPKRPVRASSGLGGPGLTMAATHDPFGERP